MVSETHDYGVPILDVLHGLVLIPGMINKPCRNQGSDGMAIWGRSQDSPAALHPPPPFWLDFIIITIVLCYNLVGAEASLSLPTSSLPFPLFTPPVSQ